MYRRIFVIDSTDDQESSVIKALMNTRTHEQHLPNGLTQDFIDFDPCKRDNCAYLFTNAAILSKIDLDENNSELELSIHRRLQDYFINDIHLILFITRNDVFNMIAYENVCYMDSVICKKSVPVICVLNACENRMTSKYIQISRKVVVDRKYDHDNSTSIEHLWKEIEKYSLKSSVVPYHGGDLNKKPDTYAQDKPPLKATNESHTRPIDSMVQNKQTDVQYQDFAKEWKESIVPGMFNERNTSIENLIKRCEKYKSQNYQYNCVLLTTGSMNPVHRSHIKNLELVKKYLQSCESKWCVLGGYLSPTHDQYVSGKLGKATIPGHHRCYLCELAIREHENETRSSYWLNVSRAESEYSNGFVDFGPTTVALCQYLNSILLVSKHFVEYPIYVIYVCGLDHFNKCPDVRRLAREKYIKCAVVYRQNSDEQCISRLDESSNIIYVPLGDERANLIDISSTEIRRRWRNSPQSLIELTYASVIERLREMKFNF